MYRRVWIDWSIPRYVRVYSGMLALYERFSPRALRSAAYMKTPVPRKNGRAVPQLLQNRPSPSVSHGLRLTASPASRNSFMSGSVRALNDSMSSVRPASRSLPRSGDDSNHASTRSHGIVIAALCVRREPCASTASYLAASPFDSRSASTRWLISASVRARVPPSSVGTHSAQAFSSDFSRFVTTSS